MLCFNFSEQIFKDFPPPGRPLPAVITRHCLNCNKTFNYSNSNTRQPLMRKLFHSQAFIYTSLLPITHARTSQIGFNLVSNASSATGYQNSITPIYQAIGSGAQPLDFHLAGTRHFTFVPFNHRLECVKYLPFNNNGESWKGSWQKKLEGMKRPSSRASLPEERRRRDSKRTLSLFPSEKMSM